MLCIVLRIGPLGNGCDMHSVLISAGMVEVLLQQLHQLRTNQLQLCATVYGEVRSPGANIILGALQEELEERKQEGGKEEEEEELVTTGA